MKNRFKEWNQRPHKSKTMSSFRKQRGCKISETLELSLQDYNVINQGLQSKSRVDHGGLWANFIHRLMNICQDWERKQHASLDDSETFGRSWKSEWKLRTPLNHCVVCLGMPMFTERSLMRKKPLIARWASTSSLCECFGASYTITPTLYHQMKVQK